MELDLDIDFENIQPVSNLLTDYEFKSTVKTFTYATPDVITIVCDWLEVFGMVTYEKLFFDSENYGIGDTKIIECDNGIVYSFTGKSNLRFKKIFEVHYNGRLVGVLQMNPKKLLDNMTTKSAVFKIANDILYSKDWTDYYLNILDLMTFKVNNVTRLDIAIDGCNQINAFMNFYFKEDAENQELLCLGKAILDGQYLDRKTRNYSTFYLGKRNSLKHLKIYNKSKQLKDESVKPYIKDFWKLNGFDLDSPIDVQRIEITLDSRYLKSIDEFDVSYLKNDFFLRNLFKTASKNFFEFRIKNNYETNISRLVPINLIPFEKIANGCNMERIPRHELPVNDKNYSAKISIRNDVLQLLSKDIKVKDRDAFYTVLKQKIQSQNLVRWFERKLPEFIKNYKCFNRTGHVFTDANGEISEEITDLGIAEEVAIKTLENCLKILKSNNYVERVSKELLTKF